MVSRIYATNSYGAMSENYFDIDRMSIFSVDDL